MTVKINAGITFSLVLFLFAALACESNPIFGVSCFAVSCYIFAVSL